MSGLLLDTHIWIWYAIGDEKITKTIRKTINTAIQKNEIYIAAISLWEISMLESKKCIIFEMPCLEWINKAIAYTHANVLPLTSTIAVECCNLPGKFHEDPTDRMIVATARAEGLRLVTRDKHILSYSQHKFVSTIKA